MGRPRKYSPEVGSGLPSMAALPEVGLQSQGHHDSAEVVQALGCPVMLDRDLESFVLGQVVLDARECRLLPGRRCRRASCSVACSQFSMNNSFTTSSITPPIRQVRSQNLPAKLSGLGTGARRETTAPASATADQAPECRALCRRAAVGLFGRWRWPS